MTQKVEKIPLKTVPVQKISVNLSGQDVVIALVPRLGKLYATITLNRQVIVRERACLNAVPLVNEAYRGMSGDLFFVDLHGKNDPIWQELGSRFVLCYVKADT